MSFPKSGGGSGGGGGPSNSGKAMRLLLDGNTQVNIGEITKIPFDQIPFNDGFSWNADLEVEAQEAGSVLIIASIGAIIPVGMVDEINVGCLLYKNGLPLRQNSKTKKEGPFCIAEINVIDQCVFEDKYELYVIVTGGDDATAEISAAVDVTALEIAYL